MEKTYGNECAAEETIENCPDYKSRGGGDFQPAEQNGSGDGEGNRENVEAAIEACEKNSRVQLQETTYKPNLSARMPGMRRPKKEPAFMIERMYMETVELKC